MRSLAVLIVVVLSTPALAQAPGETAVQPLPSPTQPADEKSPVTAVLLSTGVTTAGLLARVGGSENHNGALVLAGVGAVFLGPSTGRWYAGSTGIGSLGLRALGGATALIGFAGALGAAECEGPCTNTHGDAYAYMFFGGLGLFAGTTIYDVIMASRDASEWNSSHRPQSRYALRLKPTTISMAGHHAMGLSLAGHF